MTAMFCKTCGKRRYPTRYIALKFALQHCVKFGKAFRVYPCLDGRGWHLTTQPQHRRSGPTQGAAVAA